MSECFTNSSVTFIVTSSFVEGYTDTGQHLGRIIFPLYAELNPDQLRAAMLRSYRQLLQDVLKQARRIEHVTIILGAPWCAIQTRTLHYTRQRDFTFTYDILEGLIRNERDRIEIKKSRRGSLQSVLDIVDFEMLQVRLNGYQVENPFGQITGRAEMDILVTFVEETLHDDLVRSAAHAFHTQYVSVRSLMSRYQKALSDTAGKKVSGILIDYGAHVTDVAILREGVLYQSGSFPLGFHDLFRQVAQRLGSDMSAARGALQLVLNDHSHADLDTDIMQALQTHKDEFLAYLYRLLRDGSVDGKLAKSVYLITDEDADLLLQLEDRDLQPVQDLFELSIDAYAITSLNENYWRSHDVPLHSRYVHEVVSLLRES